MKGKSVMVIIPKPKKAVFTDGFCKVCSDYEGALAKAELICDSSLCGEHYKINISETSVTISFGTEEGKFRAMTTLSQLCCEGGGSVPCCEIEDYPDIKTRGYMLDISRGKLPKLSELKKLADMLSDLKYNQLQLYMESPVFDYKSFPDIVESDHYTSEDIAELDKYCAERFIELVPNQNSLGHMEKWLKNEKLKRLAIDENAEKVTTLNPLDPGSVELMDKIYGDLLPSFSSGLFNIGMDEPWELGSGKTKEECEKRGVGAVYTDYLLKIFDLVKNKYKKTPMFWADIVFKHEEQLSRIPKDAVVMEWGYEADHPFDRHLEAIRKNNLRFYVCPGTSMWQSYTGRSEVYAANILKAAESGAYYGAEGFLLTEWGDCGHPQFPSVTYLPPVLGGAAAWGAGSHNNEIAAAERAALLKDCKAYADKYIYKVTTGVSVSDIVFKMGKYMFLESENVFNATLIGTLMRTGKKPDASMRESMRDVASYMRGLKKRLGTAKADELSLREIAANADMVILFADYLSGGDVHEAAARLSEEFSELWEIRNYKNGEEIFGDVLKMLGSSD